MKKPPVQIINTLTLLATLTCSAAAQFATIINVPPDESPDAIGSHTQLNLWEGGVLGGVPLFFGNRLFEVGAADGSRRNVELNILGGEADYTAVEEGGSLNFIEGTARSLFVSDDGIANLSGGNFTSSEYGSSVTIDGQVNIRGGVFDLDVQVYGEAEVSGGEFHYVQFPCLGCDTASFSAHRRSRVEVTGGSFLIFAAYSESEVSIYGGTFDTLLGGYVPIDSGPDNLIPSHLTVAGGEIDTLWTSVSETVLAGGRIGRIRHSGYSLEVLGTDFLLDGQKIPGLQASGKSIVLEERGASCSKECWPTVLCLSLR